MDYRIALRSAENSLASRLKRSVVLGRRLSVGIALGHVSYTTVDGLLRDADTALYLAKEEGPGSYRVFSEDLHASALSRWQTENDLRRAIENGELLLEYQPIVSVASGEIEHFEALVRWRHPLRGLVPPAQFIPLAEETGLIVPLGRWVLAEACRQLQVWRAEPSARRVSIAVNVASKQLVRPAFVGEVTELLAAAGVPTSAIVIEVTESSLMNSAAVETCLALHALGIHLHLDDFGTGYSSLSYLNRLPIDGLKIDRSFTSTICSDAVNASIVKAVVSLAQALGIAAIAEGVESDAELRELQRIGCTNAQGYLFSRSVGGREAGAMIGVTSDGSRRAA